MLISIHIPKTAGSSFLKALQMHFGDRLVKDYDDAPINTPRFRRNMRALRDCFARRGISGDGVECIHSHFLPLKYYALGRKTGAVFITWLRDPIERLASHYQYWKRAYQPQTSKALHKRMIEENWSLERFCFGPEMRNFYHQFFWGFPLNRFDFIGIFEYFEEDFRYLAQRILKASLPVYEENVNTGKAAEVYVTDPALRAELERFHAKDMKIYWYALDLRARRREEHEDSILSR
jgi:hypothetical protein